MCRLATILNLPLIDGEKVHPLHPDIVRILVVIDIIIKHLGFTSLYDM